ncbi:hypothetical protein PENSUB_11371 [Penicillium subrubescens]|uniref:Uncharacterized protein n=1 Tax=Penicillium subrubescens TaxID=1316194 RepID=A0A1Q5T416_9EURO|nr:hypothetical protein PENSUB_11371 [Penicillium subrubescens]
MDASVAEEQEQHPSSFIPRSSSPNQKESQVYYLEKRKQCANRYFEAYGHRENGLHSLRRWNFTTILILLFEINEYVESGI